MSKQLPVHKMLSFFTRGVQFPKFPRFFPANSFSKIALMTKKAIFWSLLLILMGVNTALIRPDFFPKLIQLAKTLPAFSGHAQAEHAMELVAGLFKTHVSPTRQTKAVLGTTTQKDNQDISKQKYNTSVQRYHAWQAIVSRYPDYRDGYYQLAVLAYQLNKFSESKTYLQKVRSLDPNYPGLTSLEALFPKE